MTTRSGRPRSGLAAARSGRGLSLGFAALAAILACVTIEARDTTWIRHLWKHKFQDGQVGLCVLDESGRERAAIHPDKPFVPASNQKLLVTIAAVRQLGIDHVYRTRLWSDRVPVDGVLGGDVVISGTGDPNISGRFTGGDPTAIFRAWATSLKKRGLKRITGDLLVDDFYFDDVRFLPGWKTTQLSRWYAAQVGALNLNDNCLDFRFFPTRRGRPARYVFAPRTDYVQVENESETVRASKKLLIGLDRYEGTNRIRFRGDVPADLTDGTGTFHVTVDDPGLFFGTVLQEVFEQEGIAIEGEVVRDRARLPDDDAMVPLHEHTSTLRRDLPVILQNSQNLHAEILLKAMGAKLTGVGSVENSARAVQQSLEAIGIDAPGLIIADGSGLSPQNRVTPRTLARLLHWTSRQEFADVYRESLAVGGESGTLSRRFRRGDLTGKVFAKTGYISRVSTLSGYVALHKPSEVEIDADPSPKQRIWTFSILVNGFPKSGGLWAAKKLQEDLVEEMYRQMQGT